MANEFIIRKGFKSLQDSELTGSLNLSGNIVADGTVEASFASSTSTAISGAFDSVSSSLSSRITDQESFSSSLDDSFATDSDLNLVSSSVDSLNAATSSYALVNQISGSTTSLSSSLASELLKNTTDTLTGDLTVTGTLTAQDLHVQEVTSSIVFSSGSNKFGALSTDTQKLTGSLQVSGSIDLQAGNATFAGTLTTSGEIEGGSLDINGNADIDGNLTVLGTTALDVTGNANDNWAGRFENTNSGGYGILAKIAGTSANEKIFEARVGNSPKMLITGDGNATFAGSVTTGTSLTVGTTALVNDTLYLAEYIQHTGNTSNNIRFTTDAIAISANATFAGDITSNGGSLEVYANSSSATISLDSADATKDKWTLSTTDLAGDAYLRFTNTTLGTTVMSLRDNGNVGIGTSSPIQKLDTPNIVIGGSTIAGTFKANSLFIDNNGGNSRFYSSGADGSTKGSYEFNIMASDGNPLLTPLVINNSGNVGIGTTLPYTLLELSSTDPIIRMTDSNGVADKSIYEMRAIGASGFESLEFRSVNDANNDYNKLLVLKHGGNVGIGTDSPDESLHLKVTTGDPRLKLETGGGGDPGIIFQSANNRTGEMFFQDGSTSARFNYNHSDESFRLYAHNQTSIDFYLSETQAYFTQQIVGIGTSSPTTKLSVTDGAAMYADSNYLVQIKRNATNGNDDTSKASILLANNSNAMQIAYGGTTDRLRFIDGGAVERITLLNGGNVGIGTTSPGQPLHVVGNIKTFGHIFLQSNANGFRTVALDTTDGADNQELYLCGGGTASSTRGGQVGVYGNEVSSTGGSVVIVAGNVSTGDIDFLTANTQRMIINNAGNVGIGTTSPEQKLHVEGRGIFDSGGTSDILQIRNNNGGGVFGMTSNLFALDLASTSNFRIRQGSSVPIYLKSDGNLGIGATSPSSKLQVGDGTANVNVKVFGSGTSGIQIHTASGNIASLEQYFGDEGSLWLRLSSATKILLRANGTSYLNGGKVGIGETAPSTLLSLKGGADTSIITLKCTKNDSSWNGERIGGIDFFSEDGSGAIGAGIRGSINYVAMSSSGGSTGFTFKTGDNTERLRILNGGTVYIGDVTTSYGYSAHHIAKSSPSGYSLIVRNSDTSTTNNTVMQLNRAETTATTSGYALIYRQGDPSSGTNRMIVFANGNIQNTNNSYGSLSDERKKENIVDATPKLDDLMKVKVRNFNLIGEETKQIGVVAQELEKVFPSMIDEAKEPDSEDETLYKSVKYSVFVPMLIKSIQELKADNDSLRARIENLEN